MSAARPQQSNDRLKDYVPVAERVDKFYSHYPEGRIVTHIVEHDAERGFILMRAEVYRGPDDAMPAATGHAYEIRGEGHVNKTSYVENCETGCVGRALANCGFEVKRGIASREDMERSRARENQPHRTPPPAQSAPTPAQMGQMIEYESALEEYDIKPASLRDKLEEKYGTRELATLSTEQAGSYIDWLKAKLAQKRAQ